MVGYLKLGWSMQISLYLTARASHQNIKIGTLVGLLYMVQVNFHITSKVYGMWRSCCACRESGIRGRSPVSWATLS